MRVRNPVDYPSREAFAANVGADLVLDPGDGSRLAVLLAGVHDGYSTPQNEQFSVLFHAPAEMPPTQGIYRVENDSLGPMDIFLVPVGREGDSLQLEAVFSRFLDVENKE